jgi:SAM-dependent methyltransferase
MSAGALRVYEPEKKRVRCYQDAADASFWDAQWGALDLKAFMDHCESWPFMPWTRRYLKPEDGPILEGGCGLGQAVRCMHLAGYQVTGVDYAANTVKSLREHYPELDIREADVRKLPFPDATFAGYWSLGVIEHFLEGYDAILAEMARVVRPGGYVFITVPFMSPLRRLKARLGCYTALRDAPPDSKFYQFLLDPGRLFTDLLRHGFVPVEKTAQDGIKGFKDEVPLFRAWLQRVYDWKTAVRLRPRLDRFFSCFAGHILLIIARRTETTS